jgi:DNA replication protein DnaC
MGVDELAKLVTPELKAEALLYDPFKNGGRLVCGPTGVGKSVAGVAALRRAHGLRPANMNELWDKDNLGRSLLWVRAFDLPNARLLLKGLGEGEAPLVAAAITADFLVLDDLGWESRRAGADDVVTEVIAARYDAGRITYATTGLTLAKFTERYGSAIARRLTETAGIRGEVVDLWPSRDSK